MSVVFDTVG